MRNQAATYAELAGGVFFTGYGWFAADAVAPVLHAVVSPSVAVNSINWASTSIGVTLVGTSLLNLYREWRKAKDASIAAKFEALETAVHRDADAHLEAIRNRDDALKVKDERIALLTDQLSAAKDAAMSAKIAVNRAEIDKLRAAPSGVTLTVNATPPAAATGEAAH